MIPFMDSPLPLAALLSQLLVAFTIEFDNEAEHRMPHRTTEQGRSAPDSLHAPWLVSMAMWFNCVQHLGDEPISLRELERRARTGTNLHGMQRWGYIWVSSDSVNSQSARNKPSLGVPPRLSAPGRRAGGRRRFGDRSSKSSNGDGMIVSARSR